MDVDHIVPKSLCSATLDVMSEALDRISYDFPDLDAPPSLELVKKRPKQGSNLIRTVMTHLPRLKVKIDLRYSAET